MLSLLAAFCVSQGVLAQSKGYTIKGTSDACVDGDIVYLCNMQGFFQVVPLDSTVVTNGSFEFKGEFEGADLRLICPMHDGESVGMASFVLENADFVVNIHKGKYDKVIGGKSTALYEEYEAYVEAAYGEDSNGIWAAVTDTTKTEAERKAAREKLDKIEERVAAAKYDFIMSHISEPVVGMLILDADKELGSDRYEKILKAMEECGNTCPQYKYIMAERAATKATAIGESYTDLSLNDPEGNAVRVSGYVTKNRYTMIDFWASWCGPCLKEMPWVVKAYEAYHSKGFEVVGVSLDNNKDAWVRAIAKFNMPWPHMSDLKGWECEAAKPYNIKAIPANVLIDQNGKIVAKNLREQELLDTLESLFK